MRLLSTSGHVALRPGKPGPGTRRSRKHALAAVAVALALAAAAAGAGVVLRAQTHDEGARRPPAADGATRADGRVSLVPAWWVPEGFALLNRLLADGNSYPSMAWP